MCVMKLLVNFQTELIWTRTSTGKMINAKLDTQVHQHVFAIILGKTLKFVAYGVNQNIRLIRQYHNTRSEKANTFLLIIPFPSSRLMCMVPLYQEMDTSPVFKVLSLKRNANWALMTFRCLRQFWAALMMTALWCTVCRHRLDWMQPERPIRGLSH